MEAALFETLSDIHTHEMQGDYFEPCCECGKDSEDYAELDDGRFMCEACVQQS